jgi:stage II sporulation protein D
VSDGQVSADTLPDRRVRTRDVDFARAFEESPEPRAAVPEPERPAAVHSPVKVQKRPVRVMVRRNVREALVYSAAAPLEARMPGARETFVGRVHLEAGAGGVFATVNKERKELRLPCTLLVSSGAGQIQLGENRYRGMLVVVSESRNTLSFINILEVEDYLRGVVPLEIGNLGEADIEAVKAQAVAARTYSYRKMAARGKNMFDMVSTVSDQVYGGANAEAATSDAAIRLTKDLIMVHGNDIVRAYYHSTCAGRTANIEDVWGGESVPYLRSVSDTTGEGRPFCSGAGLSFAWTETWTERQFADIIRRYSAEGNMTPPFGKAGVRSINISERFECGRVKTMAVVSTANQAHVAGGDKLRFVIRRNTASRKVQILRSSNIRDVSVANGEVRITGNGHGHGVGMCQVGAIARARAGQSFEQILRSYYSGITLSTATPDY